ncbi:orotidine-5'-phosphate decarboxylase [Paractinoplanes hotanensis]|uniref:Orotidine-5'-phosphate decarboxylase n=1 Tax=Paractinoplanes hotanensis TaxID=2906497 RepID=A0ABT0YAN6_9ACTN|nr:orotidine-5'-phosphate decarboxylase [Actinoplanes hotanensis]MCM4083099.1 orotidine-5'-phosphate decarboxylase [Actinoplanes hotanensis]
MTVTTPVAFGERWAALRTRHGQLCLGVAPSPAWLGRWGLGDDVAGARGWCRILLDAAADRVAVFKVQVPFFLRFGAAGSALLREFRDRAQEAGALVLLDTKLCDADDTMDSWADFYLGPRSVLGGDAMTAVPYMGFGTFAPLLRRAEQLGAVVFVLARTSNHAAGPVQTGRGEDGRSIAESVADEITAWNATAGHRIGPAGALIGARQPESAELIRRLPRSLLEVPGLGRADRADAEVVAPLRGCPERALMTVTTGVLRHGPDVTALRRSVAGWQETIGGLLG